MRFYRSQVVNQKISQLIFLSTAIIMGLLAIPQSASAGSFSAPVYSGPTNVDIRAVSNSGTFKAVFTWIPSSSLANDPPPSSVVAMQTASAAWQSMVKNSGSCSNGLGDPEIDFYPTNINGFGALGKSNGTHYSIVAPDSTGKVTLTCTVSSNAWAYTNGGRAYSSIGYSASIYPITVGLSGTSVDGNKNIAALIGQNVTASLSTGPYSLSNYRWQAYGDTFSSYNVSSDKSSSSVTPINPAVWTTVSPSWRWFDNASNWGYSTPETVVASATATASNIINGVTQAPTSLGTVTAAQTVYVWAPSAVMQTISDVPGDQGPGQSSYLLNMFGQANGVTSSPNSNQTVNGITFEVDVVTPSGYYPNSKQSSTIGYGSTSDVQLCNINRACNAPGFSDSLSTNEAFELDNVYPYGDTGTGLAPSYPPPAHDPNGLEFQDMPSWGPWLLMPDTIGVTDEFKLYVLYTAPGTNVQPVPIWETDWMWNIGCSVVNNLWTPNPPGSTGILSSSYATNFPLWSSKFTNR